MNDKLGYDIFTFFFDTLWQPFDTVKLEWCVPPGAARSEGERWLQAHGVKVWTRQWDEGSPHKTASVRVRGGQRRWAEELLFVAKGYQPLGKVLPQTALRKAQVAPYQPKGRWQKAPVASGTLVSLIMQGLDVLGG